MDEAGVGANEFAPTKLFIAYSQVLKRYMNANNPDPTIEVICHCSGTTKQQIKALVDDGVDNLDRISRITGACSGCGGCDASMVELLAEYKIPTLPGDGTQT